MKPGHFLKRAWLPVLAALLLLSACSAPAAPTAAPGEPPAAAATQSSGGGSAPAATAPLSAAAEPTAAASLPDPLPLELVDQGFTVAYNDTVHYGFLVRNPNPSHAVQNSTFTATFYDANRAVLGTDDLSAIELVLPGQTVGVADGLWLDDPAVASMSIELTSGEPVVFTETLLPYEIVSTSECVTEGFQAVRAEIVSPYAANVILPRISVIYYDADGKISGGGSGYRAGLLANGKTGVLIFGAKSVNTVRYEVYTGYRGLPAMVAQPPSDAKPLQVSAQGFTQAGNYLTYDVILENPNGAYLLDQSLLSVNAYAADGSFLGGEPMPLVSVLPGQKLGISRQFGLCDETPVDRIEVAVSAEEYLPSQQTAYFGSENVTLQDGAVSGELVNLAGIDLMVFYATAIVYDAAGQVIGGGSLTVDGLAAGGRASVQIPVTVNGTPASAEIFGVLTRKSLGK